MALRLLLNGQPRTFDDLAPGASLADVVQALGLKADRVALEWRGEIVARARWAECQPDVDDKLEAVHFVGGGSGLDGRKAGWIRYFVDQRGDSTAASDNRSADEAKGLT